MPTYPTCPTCPTCRRQLALTVAVDSLLVGKVANRKLALTQLVYAACNLPLWLRPHRNNGPSHAEKSKSLGTQSN